MNLRDYRDIELLANYFELDDNITEDNLQNLSDEDLKLFYDKAYSYKEYYDNMQLIVKLCMNATYGACGSVYYRFYNPDVAEDITTEGKLAMMKVDKIINNFFQTWQNYPEIEKKYQERFGSHIKLTPTTVDICNYGDTDSRYVQFGAVFKACGYVPHNPKDVIDFVLFTEENYMQKIIADGLHDYVVNKNGDPQFFIMELETIGGKQIALAKKKYVMSLYWKDGAYIADKGKIKSTGVEIVQGSSSKFVKDSMLKVIRMLLAPKSRIENVLKIANIITEQAKNQHPKALMKTNSANNYDKYVISSFPQMKWKDKTTVQLKAAVSYNNFIQKNNLGEKFPKFIDGQKIYWYYCLPGEAYEVFGLPDGVEFEDLPGAPKMDINEQVKRLIINPLRKYIFSDSFDTKTLGQDVMQISFKKQVHV